MGVALLISFQACDFATTVSPSYAMEVADHGSVRDHQHKFTGIINGIDYGIWDPSDNEFLPMSYSALDVVEGKAAAKKVRYNFATTQALKFGVCLQRPHQTHIWG